MAETNNLKRTPLYAAHVACGAKLVPFGGWDMPVQYTSIVAEHTAVRERAGLFDISHMGEFVVAGPQAEAVLNRLLTNNISKIALGQAQYNLLCNERGGVIDDLIVYRVEPTVFLLIVNASNIDTDFAWMSAHASATAVLDNQSAQTAALALQGPKAASLLPEADGIAHFFVARRNVLGQPCWIARTGYTGEDGFEILCAAAHAEKLWNELLARGATPCGLGARDTLRLEVCYPLHGHELSPTITPIEAGLGKFVAFDKGDFIGRAVLAEQKQTGTARKLVALKMAEKTPPPRQHYPIFSNGRAVGEVTSGAPSPTLGIGIALGFVESAVAQPGAAVEIEIRGKRFPATIEKKPLVKRSS